MLYPDQDLSLTEYKISYCEFTGAEDPTTAISNASEGVFMSFFWRWLAEHHHFKRNSLLTYWHFLYIVYARVTG